MEKKKTKVGIYELLKNESKWWNDDNCKGMVVYLKDIMVYAKVEGKLSDNIQSCKAKH